MLRKHHLSYTFTLLLFCRQYRERGEETPSHPGGVTTPVREAIQKHRDKKDRGMYAGSSKDDRRRDKDRDRGMIDVNVCPTRRPWIFNIKALIFFS